MFKDLMQIFKKNNLMDKAFARSCQMISITGEMYEEVRKRLRDDITYQFSFDIMDQDIAVNKFEREVRRDVFNHLCVAGLDDLNSGLILVSIIIDIERIGDYTKNMAEITDSLQSTLKGGLFDADLLKIETAVIDTFKRVRIAFETGNQKEAEGLLEEYRWVNRLCDQHIHDYLQAKDETLSSGECVAVTLYFRYLKRINSHLRNIASSVVNPFHRIGFHAPKK
jgi:phosphate uptake regulator